MPRTITSTPVKLLALLTAIGLACGAYSCNTGPIDNSNGGIPNPNPNPSTDGSNLPTPQGPGGGDDSAIVDCTITAIPLNPCAGSTGNTACVPDTGPAEYVWTITNGTITAGQGTRCITFTADAVGTVLLTVVGDDAPDAIEVGHCEAELELQVGLSPPCEITISQACQNSTGSASIPDPGPGAVIIWQIEGGTITGGQGTSSITFTAGAGTEVKFIVSVAVNGCTKSLCKESVTLQPGPVCEITAEAPCPNSTGTASIPDPGPGAVIVWQVVGGTITAGQGTSSITFTAGAGAQVQFIASVTVNGCTRLCKETVPILPGPVCDITAEAPCPNSTGNTASIANPGAGATIVWSVSGGGTLTSGQGTSSITFSAGASGVVNLDVSVTSASGCECTDSLDLTILAAPNCTITADDVCPNSTGNTASIANPGAGATIVWTISGGTITAGQGTASITFTAGASGIVALDVTVTNAAGCECSGSLDLTIGEVPVCEITAADVCPNSTGNTASIANPGAGATIVWTISGGTITAGQGTASLTFSAGASGTVHLEVTVTSADGCECTDELDVNVTSNLTCVIAEPTEGGVFTGTISGGDAPFSCSASIDVAGWVVDSCVVNNGGNGPGFTVNYHRTDGACSPVEPPMLTVTITDDSGCETECSAAIPCPPGGCVITGGGLICEGETATLCVEPATGTLPPVTISWTGPNGFTSDDDCITVSVPGVYTATVTDGNGFESVCCAPVAVLKLKGTMAPCANSTDLVFSAHVDSSGQATFAGTFAWSISGNGTFCDGTTTANGNPVCVDAGAAGSFVLSVTATGTLNFTCDGTATSEPAVVTCTRSVTVVSCP
ncbi:MAG TPA: hypothetical protein VJZ71_12815 [Phycisphaerae bacterium]|nr:hypothetical protein [Phycisphaerae bacterium]